MSQTNGFSKPVHVFSLAVVTLSSGASESLLWTLLVITFLCCCGFSMQSREEWKWKCSDLLIWEGLMVEELLIALDQWVQQLYP